MIALPASIGIIKPASAGGGGTPRIFGYNGTVIGGGGTANDRAYLSRFVKSHAGRITTINAELGGQDGWYMAQVRAVAVADNGNTPGGGTVLWYSPAITPANGSTVQSFTLPADIGDNDPAATYWLGVALYETPGTIRHSPFTGVDTARIENFSVATPPATCPTPATVYGDLALRVWCDYTG